MHESADPTVAWTAFKNAGMDPRGSGSGWHWARGRGGDLDPATSNVAQACNAAAFGGWVADSDYAYLVFASPDGEIAARVPINDVSRANEISEQAAVSWSDLDAREAALCDLARWSARYAPQHVDAVALMKEMPGFPGASIPGDAPSYGDASPWYDSREDEGGQNGWVFAEDGVRIIYRRLGIPGPDAFVFT